MLVLTCKVGTPSSATLIPTKDTLHEPHAIGNVLDNDR